jgi:integrase
MTKFRLFIGDKSQRWYVEYYLNGKRKRVYDGEAYGMGKGGNQIKLLPIRRKYFKDLFDLVKNSPTPSNNHQIKISFELSLSDAFKIYYDAHKRILKSRTLKGNTIIFKRFINWIGPDTPLSEITSSQIITYFDSKNIAPQSINSDRSVLNTVFNYLISLDHIKQNPVTQFKKRKIISRQKNECYTNEELKLVFEGCKLYSENLYLIACLMYAAFLRSSEILQLTGSCLDFENNRIVLPAELRKTNDFFIIPMTMQLKQDLITYNKHLVNPNELVFSHNGKILSDIYSSMSFLRVKNRYLFGWIGKNQTLNSIRHTAAINYFQKTQNLKKLSSLMGHTSIQTTIIYLRSLGKIVGEIDNTELLEY